MPFPGRHPAVRRRGRAALAVALGVFGAAPARAQPADAARRGVVDATLTYTGEIVGDVAGGARRGVVYVGTAGIQLTAALAPLVGWRGARAFAFVLGTHGGAPSDLVGDVQGVSNLQASPALRLEEAWLQQNFAANRVSWLVGRYDLSTEFYRVQSAALFVNSAFGTGPEFAGSGGTGPSIFPNTTFGSRVDAKPSANTVVRLAVLRHPPPQGPGGAHGGTGALLVSEVALLTRPDTADGSQAPRHRRLQVGRGAARPYAGKLALGAWYYTARFPDVADTLATGAPVWRRGSRGAYLLGDQTVWAAAGDRPGALTAFVQLGLGDARVDRIGGYVAGGLTRTAPMARRPQDAVGLAASAALLGSRGRRLDGARLAGAEAAVELTYACQLASWLAVQPDLQAVVRPGGLRGAQTGWVPGLRVAVSR